MWRDILCKGYPKKRAIVSILIQDKITLEEKKKHVPKDKKVIL